MKAFGDLSIFTDQGNPKEYCKWVESSFYLQLHYVDGHVTVGTD